MATSRRAHRGLGSSADRSLACCTGVVVQWLTRHGKKKYEGMESDVQGFHSERRKRCAVSRKLSISCHTWGLEGAAGVVDSMASRLLRRPSSAAAISA